MKVDQLKLYILEILLTIILFITLIVSNKINNIELALILSVFAILFKITIKKKRILSTNKSQANILLIACGILYLLLFYLLGFIINSFLKSPTLFSIKTIYRYIIPTIIIVISSEVIRMKLLSHEVKLNIFNKKINTSELFAFIITVLIDAVLLLKVYTLDNLSDLLNIVGFVLFSSISCNLFFNYYAKRYGIKGIIIYRLITSLYTYLIPIIPDVYVFFKSFARMIYPFIMYLIIEKTYAKVTLVSSQNEKQRNIISVIVSIIIMILIIMLISCKFTYGVLVIGSNSMKGTIDRGDVALFKKKDKNEIDKGKIIVFTKNGITLIHRIVDKRNINGEIRYYTKGDANKNMDADYILDKDIIGTVELKIKYIGAPTLWVNDLFNN